MSLGVPDLAAFDARRLEFVSPGLLHTLGNGLFAVQGNASVLAPDGRLTRHRNAIMDGCDKALYAVEVLRVVAGEAADDKVQAGLLLRQVAHVCSVPMRVRQLQLDVARKSQDAPKLIERRRFTLALIDTLWAITQELPAVVEGIVTIDLIRQNAREIAVEVKIEPKRALLPFPLELPAIRRTAEPVLRELGAVLTELDDSRLVLCVPRI